MNAKLKGPKVMIRTESEAQVERWQAEARRAKRSLSDWIRLQLDAAAKPAAEPR